MKLSVITINLNNSRGLQQTIESIVCQTFTNYELIIIDGGSNDGSVDIIKQYEDRVSYWISESDKGIYDAMNKGIKQAKGEYYYFLNSGDRLISEVVFTGIFADNPSSSFICGNFITEFHGNFKKEEPYKNRDWQFSLYDLYSGDLCHQAFFIKADNFDKYGLYDDSLRITADWKLFFNAIAIHHEPVSYKDIDIVIYNMEGLSSTIGGQVIFAERKKIIHELLPESTADKLDRLLYLEQNSYITDIIRSRRWLFTCFRAFCKLARIFGFIKS